MERERTDEQIEDLRKARDRGLGEEGRTKEEQDRAMMPETAPDGRGSEPDAEEAGGTTSDGDEQPER